MLNANKDILIKKSKFQKVLFYCKMRNFKLENMCWCFFYIILSRYISVRFMNRADIKLLGQACSAQIQTIGGK